MSSKRPEISPAVQKRLELARIARLATTDTQGRPHIVPVCFAFDGEFFFTAVDRKPKRVAPERLVRLQNIREVSQVALVIDEYDEDWTQLWYVLVRGKAALIPDSAPQRRASALANLRAKYPQYSAGMLPDDAPIIQIDPERIIAWGKID